MKKSLSILLTIILLSLFAKAQNVEIRDWWNDLSVFQVNKMPPRTNVIPTPVDDYSRCLNSDWRFNYVKTPEEKIEGFYNTDITAHWIVFGRSIRRI